VGADGDSACWGTLAVSESGELEPCVTFKSEPLLHIGSFVWARWIDM
jgi:hypothetical protein